MAISIKDIPFFQGLGSEELEAVRQCLREKSFSRGESLFLEGNACERVFFVRSGRVKMFRMSASGREQILEILKPGDSCACNPGAAEWHCSSSAEALEDCTVWYLSREHYVRLVKDQAKLAHALNRLFAERLQCFSSLIEEVSLKDSRKRLVKFLLDMRTDSPKGPGGAILLPYTREELAQRLGMTRETVARQISELKRKRLIATAARSIRILDPEGLRKLLG